MHVHSKKWVISGLYNTHLNLIQGLENHSSHNDNAVVLGDINAKVATCYFEEPYVL